MHDSSGGRSTFGGGTTERAGAPDLLVRSERVRRRRVAWKDHYGAHEVVIEGRSVLGMSPESGVFIADRGVSRIHCELDPTPEGLWVRDLGSRNGTVVDGVRVTGALAAEGATIHVGGTSVTVGYEEDEVESQVWRTTHMGPMVGGSLAMRTLFASIARLAATDLSVLVLGETGTGKELVARALHDTSARAHLPFGVVDCGAMPEHLLEAELFGHTRGAFTGADAAREGIVERSEGGTLFLDEIGELPLPMQPKLLRLLETRTYKRIGDTRTRKTNVRFVAATHRDLGRLANVGAFREDLYFRVAVAILAVPALRDRPEDIDALVEHFLGAGDAKVSRKALAEHAKGRAWPGNVRELRSYVERAKALGVVDPSLLEGQPARAVGDAAAPPLVASGTFKEVRDAWMDHLERQYIGGLLNEHARNVTKVAHAAGLDRTYVHRLMKKHGL